MKRLFYLVAGAGLTPFSRRTRMEVAILGKPNCFAIYFFVVRNS